MRYRTIGSTGMEGSVIGLGTWAIGGWMWGGTDRAAAVDAIRSSIDEGVTFIDTAPIYGMGLSEQIVGEAIGGRRDEVVIATKCGLVWDFDRGEYYFDANGRPVYRNLAPEAIRFEVEKSLERLNIERIDVYQTHWQDPTTPIDETMGELERLRSEGKIAAIGVCNITPDQFDEYRASGTLDTDQEKFNMLDRSPLEALVPSCERHGVTFLSYSTLALGLLTGKVGPDRTFPDDDLRSSRERFSVGNRRKAAVMLAEIQPVADRHGITLGQLAIAWAVNSSDSIIALVGARTPGQAAENALAGDVILDTADMETIERAISTYGAEIP